MTKTQKKMMMNYLSERTTSGKPSFNLKALQQFFLRKNMHVSRDDMRDVLKDVLLLDSRGEKLVDFKPRKFQKMLNSL